jgi:hypothetical protein
MQSILALHASECLGTRLTHHYSRSILSASYWLYDGLSSLVQILTVHTLADFAPLPIFLLMMTLYLFLPMVYRFLLTL